MAEFRKMQEKASVGLANAGGTPEQIAAINAQRKLMKACFFKDVDQIKASLGEGVDPSIKLSANSTPFHIACARGLDNAILKDMLSKGSDVRHTNDLDFTCLHMAALNGKKDTCKFLIEQGAAKDSKNLRGQTPADLAEKHGFRGDLE